MAKTELALKGKRLGIGVGAFRRPVGCTRSQRTAAAISRWRRPRAWLAALIVGAGYGAIAGVLALTGKQKVEEAPPPVPEQAIESTKTDVQHTTQRAREARS